MNCDQHLDVVDIEREKRNEKRRMNRKLNKEKILERERVYFNKNKEKIMKYRKEYREKNKEIISKKDMKYREKNKKYLSEKSIIYRIKHRDELCEKHKEYYLKHKKEYSEKGKIYRRKNKDKISKQKREEYIKNSDIYKERVKKYRLLHINKLKKYFKDLGQKRKKIVLDHYSDGLFVCINCKESRYEGLTIDHIHGGGRKHAKEVGKLYRWLIKNKFPEGYQVLCMNCQIRKRRDNNENHRSEKYLNSPQYKCQRKLRYDVLSAYSKKPTPICKICNETELDVLELDHIDGGGDKDRQLHNRNLYTYLRKNNFSDKDKYQVLCATCNRIKKQVNGEHRK